MPSHAPPKRSEERRSVPPPPLFVGRAIELDRLKSVLLGDAGPRLRVAVIEGVAGVGKSALAQAFGGSFSEAKRGPIVSFRARSEPLGLLLDDLRRLSPGGRVRERTSNSERLDDLAD